MIKDADLQDFGFVRKNIRTYSDCLLKADSGNTVYDVIQGNYLNDLHNPNLKKIYDHAANKLCDHETERLQCIHDYGGDWEKMKLALSRYDP